MTTSDRSPEELLARLLSPYHLHLILLPTEQCNFRCLYCYEDFAVGRMREATVRGIEALIARRVPKLTSLEIEWFGGEPLAASDIVLGVTSRARKLCEASGAQFLAGATTNGWLLDADLAARLAEAGVYRLQISLDGPAHIHDQTRRRASGAGTFARIWSNLLHLKQSDLDFLVLLRLHVTRANLAALPEFVDELTDTFLFDRRFRLFVKAVEHFGGPHDAEVETLSHADSMAAVAALETRARRRLGADAVVPNTTDDHICYAARANSLIVRADGSIAKCTVALRDPRNSIGHIGEDGALRLDQERLRPWLRGVEDFDPHTLSCPLHGMAQEATRAALDVERLRVDAR